MYVTKHPQIISGPGMFPLLIVFIMGAARALTCAFDCRCEICVPCLFLFCLCRKSGTLASCRLQMPYSLYSPNRKSWGHSAKYMETQFHFNAGLITRKCQDIDGPITRQLQQKTFMGTRAKAFGDRHETVRLCIKRGRKAT